MTFSQSYNFILQANSQAYLWIMGIGLAACCWIGGEMFNPVTPERMEMLEWFFRHALGSTITALTGWIGVKIFLHTGFVLTTGYKKWFLEKACQKPWLFGLDRINTQMFGVLILIFSFVPFVTAMTFPVVAVHHLSEITDRLLQTAL